MNEELTSLQQSTNKKGRTIRIIAIAIVIGLIFAALITSTTSRPKVSEQVWDPRTTVGAEDPTRHYIMYTDLMCPYCDIFSRLTTENWDQFTAYLNEHGILFEVRLTDYLHVAVDSEYSRTSAEATYCAIEEDRFWDYYHNAVQSLWDDYHSKGVGSSKTAPPIEDLPDDYWLKIGHEVGLGEKFDSCVKNHQAAAILDQNTKKSLQIAQGMPYFDFENFQTSGFGEDWGFEYVLMYLEEGL